MLGDVRSKTWADIRITDFCQIMSCSLVEMLWRFTGRCCFDSHGRPDEEGTMFSRNVGVPLWNYNAGVASQHQPVFIFTVTSTPVFKMLLLRSYSSLDGFKLLNIILRWWSFYSQNLGNPSSFRLMCLLTYWRLNFFFNFGTSCV